MKKQKDILSLEIIILGFERTTTKQILLHFTKYNYRFRTHHPPLFSLEFKKKEPHSK